MEVGLSKVQLIIFDLDGVLVDACEWHRVALNQALLEVCNYEISLKSHYDHFNGLPTKTKLQKLTSSGVIKETDHEQIYSIKQEKTKELISGSLLEPSKDKSEMMEYLRSQKVIIACCTNSIKETTILMLEKSGLGHFLSYIVTNECVKNPKPDPEGYLKIIEHFKISKDNTVIIEDSPKGLQAARAVGCRVIEVKNATEVTLKKMQEILS